jgi:hypothetical protein
MDLAVPIVVSCLSVTIGGLAAMGETPVSAFKKVMSTVLAKATDGGANSGSARNSNSSSRRNSNGNVQEAAKPPPPPQPAAPAPSPPRPPPPAQAAAAQPPNANKNSANKNARPNARNGASKDDERKAFVPYPAKGDTAKQRNDMNEYADDGNAGRTPLW